MGLLQSLKTPRGIFATTVLALFAAMPFIAPALGEPYYVNVFTRIMIWSIAAVSLNLILGFGGMISFGHAVYVGIGGYTVGILAYHDVTSGWLQWPLALLLCATAALVFGTICLRTRGVYFIMITLAFAQMIYFLSVSAEEYGSDDGLLIYELSQFGDWYDLSNDLTFYYTAFASLLIALFIVHKIVNSRFGMVIRGAKSNELRMEAIGFSTYRYKLTCFVIAGVLCGLAGVLTANNEEFVSPDLMHWTISGELIFMVVLGGMGTLFGPVSGTLVFLFLSEFLSNITEKWHLIFGPFLILVVLFAHRGIDAIFDWRIFRRGGADE
jgi:branched-chain amino acid transport system permease protein